MKLVLMLLSSALMTLAAEPNIMPLPASYTFGPGRLTIDGNFRAALTGYSEPRLRHALARLADRLSRQTGIPLPGGPAGATVPATLVIECKGASRRIQALDEDESYTLNIDPSQARLSAANPLGVLRGLETFLQLVDQDVHGFGIATISIQDQPRFPWRGLTLDVARHWMPPEVIRRTLDGMAAVKMNVFHWHLADDQGFRVESKRYPKLHQMGSDGHYYTHEQVREIIAYARERGIRVVPEFDMPGHTTSWLVGYPELATEPGPYAIERKWGVFDAVMDPARDGVYTFLDGFIGEMAALFDDAYFHIGGDEVNGKQWTASVQVQAFLKQHGLKDNHEFQRYFNRRVQEIVKKHGKRMEGWDEILDPDLPKDIVMQSWRGQKSLVEAARQGYSGLLSSGYYLDLMHNAETHYLVDPVNEEASTLTEEQRARILGGEAAEWVEYATTENVDARIWPRAAAIAERLWSPQSVRDPRSMYTRLEPMSRRLESLGLEHRRSYVAMLERLAGNDPIGPLQVFAAVIEPVKGYAREEARSYSLFTPLNRLVDAANPDSGGARDLRYAIEDKRWTAARKTLETWRDNGATLRPTLESHALLSETIPISEDLTRVAAIGLEALDYIEGGRTAPADWAAPRRATLVAAAKPVAELLLMAVPGVTTLVNLAAGSAQ